MRCASITGAVDSLAWDSAGRNLTVGLTALSGEPFIDRVDAATLDAIVVVDDPLLATTDVSPGKGDRVYYRRLGTPSILEPGDNGPTIVVEPDLVTWSRLAWTERGFVVTTADNDGSVVALIDLTSGSSTDLFRTQDRVDGISANFVGDRIAISHAAYPETEVALPGGSLTVLDLESGGRNEFQMPIVASSISMAPSGEQVYIVDADLFRLGVMNLHDGSVRWLASDVDLVDAASTGALAIARRTQSPDSDEICIYDDAP